MAKIVNRRNFYLRDKHVPEKMKVEEVKIIPEDDPVLYKETGNEAFKLENYEDAIEQYTKAIKIGEKHKELPIFYKNRAACYLKLEKYEKAERDCSKSLELAPKDPKALFRRCQALEALGRIEEAYRDARGVLESDPGNKTIQPVLERLHAIVQERVRENAQISNKVRKMLDLAFDLTEQDLEKRKLAMNNLVVLSKEKTGTELMFDEHVLQKIGRLAKVEKCNDIIVNMARVVDNLCLKSVARTKAVVQELGIPWFLKMLNSEDDERIMAMEHCMQTVLNSFSGMENKDDSKPDKELTEANKKEIDFLLSCLVHAINDPILKGKARDAVMELLTRNVHWKYLDWAERLIDQKGLLRLMNVCSELEEYTYESAIPITPSSRTIASVCLARIYDNMYYDTMRQKYTEQIQDFVKDKLLEPTHESKVRVTVAITALLLGPLDVGNQIVAKEGILQMILAMATYEEDILQQKVACECIIAAASKKDKAKSLVQTGMDILKKLYHSKDEGIRVRALVGICKLGSVGGTDASIRPLADGSTMKLAEACRRFLIKPGKDKDIRKWATEGLSYLTLDADVKEKLIEDKPALRAMIELAKTGDQSVLFGVVTTLVNLCNAYEKQEVLPELVQLAKYAKQHVPEEHELDDPDFVAKRCIALTNEGVTTALVALSKTESPNSREMIARVFNALAAEQCNRGKIVQQGGAKALLNLALDGTANGKRHAGQALSRLGITINPEVAFPGQRCLEVVRVFLNQLHPECSALENFEALMALCNLAQMSETVRKRILREQGLSKVEQYITEDHLLLSRAAAQCICNLCMSDYVVKEHEKENDRIKLLLLYCEEEDEDTAIACSGALAILSSESEKCCEKIMQVERWLEIFRILLANPSPAVQHRGIVMIFNVIKAKKEYADKIFDTDLMQMLHGVTQLNDEKRAPAMEVAHQILKYAEEHKIIEENKEIANLQMPDPFVKKKTPGLEEEEEDEE